MGRRIVTISLAWTLAAVFAPALVAPAQAPPASLPNLPFNGNYPANDLINQPPPPLSTTFNALLPVQAITGQPTSEGPPTTLPNENKSPTGGTNGAVPPLEPTPGSKGGPIEPPVLETPNLPLPLISTRKFKIGNRSSSPTNAKYMTLANGDQIAIITGGIKLLATFQDRSNLVLDIESDSLVVWQKGGQTAELVEGMRDNDGVTQTTQRDIELYMTGNVVMRYGTLLPKLGAKITEDKVMRAERVYYDVTHNRAVAQNADLELLRSDLPVPAHYKAPEMFQLSPNEFTTSRAVAAASKLPDDAGLDMFLRHLTLTEEKDTTTRTIFGFPVIDRETGANTVGTMRHFVAENNVVEIEDIPVFYFPYLAGDPANPTGPLDSFAFREDTIFGAQIYTTWDILELAGIKKLPNEHFDLNLDYLSERGPGFGAFYDLNAQKLFGFDAPFTTHIQVYGIYDQGQDQLDGQRDLNWNLPEPGESGPPGWRGRAYARHVQEYDDFSFQGQVAYLSDPNFLEQYYKNEFDQGPNQETFGYLKYQTGTAAATLLAEPNLDRYWVTESQWLPKLDGWLMGQSFFDRISYNTWASVGYSNLQVYNVPLNQMPLGFNPATIPTEQGVSTGRVDWMQQASVPFSLGFLKLVPYANLDLAYYSEDEEGDSVERYYVGGGIRGSTTFTRQFDDVDSEFLNVHGLNHKITLNANYYSAYSNVSPLELPQLDRLNDDATLQAVKDMQPYYQTFYPGTVGNALLSNPLYNPILYANRRLVDSDPDTLGTMESLQLDVDQRWQTKRGYPGMEHTVDYITLDVSASYFPAANRDDFGHSWAFLEYYARWAIGDRTGLTSYAWVDPFDNGTRLFNINAYFNRPDGTSYNLGYTSYEPLNSRLVYGSVSYTFSPKYSLSFNASYDLTIQNNESVGFTLNRIGTDLTWSIGFSYNALVNNFGFQFMVLPNLVAAKMAGSGASSSLMGSH